MKSAHLFAIVVAGRVLDRLETEHEAEAYARAWHEVTGQKAHVRGPATSADA